MPDTHYWPLELERHEAEQSGDTARCPYTIREWAMFGLWPEVADDPWEGIEHSEDKAMAMRADDPTRRRREE